MAKRFFPQYVLVMALRHQWLRQARIELDETLDYLFCEFGGRSAEKLYVEVEKCIKRSCLGHILFGS